MPKPRKLNLAQLGLEFWLPLPLIAGMFWLGSSWLNQQVLSQSAEPTIPLAAPSPAPVSLALEMMVASINAEIDPQAGTTEVNIQAVGGSLKELEFEYPVVAYADIEQAIAQELGLSRDTVRSIIRYHIDY